MRYTVTLLLVLWTCAGIAQSNECGSIGTEQERRYMRYLEQVYDSVNPLRIYEDNVVKVGMYRLRNDDGSGARSDEEFAEEINRLNTYYNNNDICFSLVRIENVDNSSYFSVDWSQPDIADSMKSVINSDNPSFGDAVTIYVLPPSTWYRGSSYGIPSTALLMTSNTDGKWGTSHLAHEMGHVLGNFHTHDDSEGLHLEVVNRFCPIIPLPNDQGLWFDCCTGADGLVDTEADPILNDTTSYGTWRVDAATCTYEDTTWNDVFGDQFHPQVSNIMSYAPVNCRNSFTGQQWNRMHLTLDLNTEFNNKQAATTRELNGETISSGHRHEMAKQTILVSNNSDYQVSQSAQVVHEAELYVDLKPGFLASPSSATGYYIGRPRDLCQNDTLHNYTYRPSDSDTLVESSFGEGIIYEDLLLTASDGEASDQFGTAVAADGDYVAISTYKKDVGPYSEHGKVYIYYFNGTNWIQQAEITPSDSASYIDFGWSVDLKGRYLIVGAPGATGDKGKAYIYKRNASTWFERGILTGSNTNSFDRFGSDVAITDGYAIVSAPGQDVMTMSSAGAVYIFNEDGILWEEQQMLEPPTPKQYGDFGNSVDIESSRVIISDPEQINGGRAYTFTRSGTSWSLETTIEGSSTVFPDKFGSEVALENGTAVVTAPQHDVQGISARGMAYVFALNETWEETDTLSISDFSNFAFLGQSLALRNDEIILSASNINSSGANPDRVYLFKQNGLGEWQERVIFSPSSDMGNNSFGRGIGLSANHAIIGSPDLEISGNAAEGGALVYERQ